MDSQNQPMPNSVTPQPLLRPVTPQLMSRPVPVQQAVVQPTPVQQMPVQPTVMQPVITPNPLPALPTNTNVPPVNQPPIGIDPGIAEDKNNTKLIIVLAVILLILVIVVAGLFLVWQSRNAATNTQTDNPISYPASYTQTSYEPQDLQFDSSNGSSTVDKVIDDTDKALTTTTDDSNFKDLDVQGDFQITN